MESYSLRPPHLTNDAAFGIQSMFLPPGGNGSVCSASKAIEDAGRRIFAALLLVGIIGLKITSA